MVVSRRDSGITDLTLGPSAAISSSWPLNSPLNTLMRRYLELSISDSPTSFSQFYSPLVMSLKLAPIVYSMAY